MHTMRSGHVKDLGTHPARGNKKSVADNALYITVHFHFDYE